MAHEIIKELSLAPDQLATEIGRLMEMGAETETFGNHDLLVLGHAYAVIRTLADIFPDHYPTSWADHMSGVIELNDMVQKVVRRNLELCQELTALRRRMKDLRTDLMFARNEKEALGRVLHVDNGKPFNPKALRTRTDGLPS